MEISEFQKKPWLDRLRRDFYSKYAYGFEDKEDVFSSIVADVIVTKLPQVTLTNKEDPAGYVLGMFRKRVIDYFRHYHGRHRPPKAMQCLPEPYPQIFYEFCLGGFEKSAIAEKLGLEIKKVEFWVNWLYREQRCPPKMRAVSLDQMNLSGSFSDVPEYHPSIALSSVEQAYSDEYEHILAQWIIGNFSDGSFSHKPPVANDSSVHNLLNNLSTLPKPAVEADDVLILKMRYFDDMKREDIARLMKLSTNQVDYRLKTTIETLKAYLNRHGIGFDD